MIRAERPPRPQKADSKVREDLEVQYYQILSKPRSEIFAQRPRSAQSLPVARHAASSPEVVRATTPFHELYVSGRGRSPSFVTAQEMEASPSFAELIPGDPDLSSFGIASAARSTSATSKRSEKLSCFVNDKPVSFFTSPLRRGTGRFRAAALQALRSDDSTSVPALPQFGIANGAGGADTLYALNRLLRCGSAKR